MQPLLNNNITDKLRQVANATQACKCMTVQCALLIKFPPPASVLGTFPCDNYCLILLPIFSFRFMAFGKLIQLFFSLCFLQSVLATTRGKEIAGALNYYTIEIDEGEDTARNVAKRNGLDYVLPVSATVLNIV